MGEREEKEKEADSPVKTIRVVDAKANEGSGKVEARTFSG